MKVLNMPLFEKQQKEENTDCSFVFNVPADNDDKTSEKVIHAHKLILSTVSPYFETNFKSEWKGNEPIRVTTFKYAVFEKMIEVVYLSFLSFETLDEALDLYEAAHFYQIEEVLNLLREEIPKYWMAHKTIQISKLINSAWKYQDLMLIQFCTKSFTVNASSIICDADWLNYTPEVIIFFYKSDDVSAMESDLLKALEKFISHHHAIIPTKTLKPAVDSIRFHALENDVIKKTSLLTQAEKNVVLKRKEIDVAHVSKSKEGRTVKPFFSHLSFETQYQLADKYSKERCWYCKAFHSVLTCQSVRGWSIYAQQFTSINIQQQSKNHIIEILNCFKANAKSYTGLSYFANLDDEIKNTFYV